MPLKGAIMHFDIYNRHYNTILLLRIITLKFGGRDINKFLVCFIAHFKKLLCNAFYPLRIMILIGIRNRDNATQVRAVSISYKTNLTFPNSPYLDKFTVMGVVIVANNL